MFACPKKALTKLAPYLSVVLKTLRLVVPAAGPLVGLSVSQTADANRYKDQIGIMKAIVDSLPPVPHREKAIEHGVVSARYGAALRAFRSLLMSLDSSAYFGGLERVFTPAGDLLWVYPEHYTAHVEEFPVLT